MGSNLVVIRIFSSMLEAELASGMLQSAGIDSVIPGEEFLGIQPGLWLGGIPLLVPTDDLARGTELLDTPNGPEDEDTTPE